MSCPAFAWALAQGAALDLLPSDRLVLIYLADMANGELVCWPGQPTIERFTGLKNNTVRAAVHRLTGLHLIRVEATPGKVTRYHILRSMTPANGATPANEHRVATPANEQGVTPSNGTRAPPQNGAGHPLNRDPRPPQTGCLTPSNGHTDPSSTQEETLDARERAQGKQDFKSGGEGSWPAPAPEPPAKAPVIGTTSGSAGTIAPIPGVRSSDAYLDNPSADDALPKAEADAIADNGPVVDPAKALAEWERVKRALTSHNYPPRAASLTTDEQITVCAPPRIKPAHLSAEVLRQMPHRRLAAA